MAEETKSSPKAETPASSTESKSNTDSSENKSVDPERQKVITPKYRNGWDSIWGKKKKK